MQKLHLVMGGRVRDPQGLEFVELESMKLVGVYPDYESAEDAWRGQAQRTVDDAEMKYRHRPSAPAARTAYAGGLSKGLVQDPSHSTLSRRGEET